MERRDVRELPGRRVAAALALKGLGVTGWLRRQSVQLLTAAELPLLFEHYVKEFEAQDREAAAALDDPLRGVALGSQRGSHSVTLGAPRGSPSRVTRPFLDALQPSVAACT